MKSQRDRHEFTDLRRKLLRISVCMREIEMEREKEKHLLIVQKEKTKVKQSWSETKSLRETQKSKNLIPKPMGFGTKEGGGVIIRCDASVSAFQNNE